MKVLFATSELAPLVAVGGLAHAASGLVKALTAAGVDVTVVLPDYGSYDAGLGEPEPLNMPPWVGITTFRRGRLSDGTELLAVHTPAMRRVHPYTDADGNGWHDNDFRFTAFSAAIARLAATVVKPDLVHLNDWHTGAALGFLERPVPSVTTIHNLAFQGIAAPDWLGVMRNRPDAYEWFGATNPLAGAVALSDYVVTVSPNYAAEIRRPEYGEGLDGALRARGDRLVGIRNGIDTAIWDPATDPHLPRPFDASDLSGKAGARKALLAHVDWPPERSPIVGMVTRLTHQKGIDLALEMAPFLHRLPARMVILGSGERHLVEAARWATVGRDDRLRFVDAYDEALSHRIFGGADLLLMPSRFEPCGLAQMQAMRYGTIPVVTDVGGLRDTVSDADFDPEGTGFVAPDPSPMALLDALHRAVRAWRSAPRRKAVQRRGMAQDWSWTGPAARQIEIYEAAREAHIG